MIAEFALDMLEESSGTDIGIGDAILLTRVSEISGMKIREVPIVGIHRLEMGAQLMVSYLDAENARILSGLTQITDIEAALTAGEPEEVDPIAMVQEFVTEAQRGGRNVQFVSGEGEGTLALRPVAMRRAVVAIGTHHHHRVPPTLPEMRQAFDDSPVLS